jgi:hypothetical protein
MPVAQFARAILQQAHERPVDVAEAEEAEVEGRFQSFKVSAFQRYNSGLQTLKR